MLGDANQTSATENKDLETKVNNLEKRTDTLEVSKEDLVEVVTLLENELEELKQRERKKEIKPPLTNQTKESSAPKIVPVEVENVTITEHTDSETGLKNKTVVEVHTTTKPKITEVEQKKTNATEVQVKTLPAANMTMVRLPRKTMGVQNITDAANIEITTIDTLRKTDSSENKTIDLKTKTEALQNKTEHIQKKPIDKTESPENRTIESENKTMELRNETERVEKKPVEVQSKVDVQNKTLELMNKTADIQNKTTDLQNKTSDVKNATNEVKEKAADLGKKALEVQNMMVELQNETFSLGNKTSNLENKTTELQKKTVDLENKTIDLQNVTVVLQNKTVNMQNKTTDSPPIPGVTVTQPNMSLPQENVTAIQEKTKPEQNMTVDLQNTSLPQQQNVPLPQKNTTVEQLNTTSELQKKTLENSQGTGAGPNREVGGQQNKTQDPWEKFGHPIKLKNGGRDLKYSWSEFSDVTKSIPWTDYLRYGMSYNTWNPTSQGWHLSWYPCRDWSFNNSCTYYNPQEDRFSTILLTDVIDMVLSNWTMTRYPLVKSSWDVCCGGEPFYLTRGRHAIWEMKHLGLEPVDPETRPERKLWDSKGKVEPHYQRMTRYRLPRAQKFRKYFFSAAYSNDLKIKPEYYGYAKGLLEWSKKSDSEASQVPWRRT